MIELERSGLVRNVENWVVLGLQVDCIAKTLVRTVVKWSARDVTVSTQEKIVRQVGIFVIRHSKWASVVWFLSCTLCILA